MNCSSASRSVRAQQPTTSGHAPRVGRGRQIGADASSPPSSRSRRRRTAGTSRASRSRPRSPRRRARADRRARDLHSCNPRLPGRLRAPSTTLRRRRDPRHRRRLVRARLRRVRLRVRHRRPLRDLARALPRIKARRRAQPPPLGRCRPGRRRRRARHARLSAHADALARFGDAGATVAQAPVLANSTARRSATAAGSRGSAERSRIEAPSRCAAAGCHAFHGPHRRRASLRPRAAASSAWPRGRAPSGIPAARGAAELDARSRARTAGVRRSPRA